MRKHRCVRASRIAIAALVLVLAILTSLQVAASSVRFIYLVPSNRIVDQSVVESIEVAAMEVREWYATQMGNGSTFALHDPVVQVIQSAHGDEWYSAGCEDTEPWCFWYRVKDDAKALAGVRFNDAEYVWVIYVDAEPACGQSAGATAGGVVILPRHDLEGITGATGVQYQCGEVETRGVDRWIGGLAHELGHAFGLPHPPACEDRSVFTRCPADCLMFTGYVNYPNTYLLDSNRHQLLASGFFSSVTVSRTETLHVLASTWGGETTTYRYVGKVELDISGTVDPIPGDWWEEDAFYAIALSDGSQAARAPYGLHYSLSGCACRLECGGLSVGESADGSYPPFQISHAYRVTLDVGSVPVHITFGIADCGTGDNEGSYRITITGQTGS